MTLLGPGALPNGSLFAAKPSSLTVNADAKMSHKPTATGSRVSARREGRKG